MDYDLLTKWSNPDLPFTCRACCFDDDTYSASRALQRYVDLGILSFILTVIQWRILYTFSNLCMSGFFKINFDTDPQF